MHGVICVGHRVHGSYESLKGGATSEALEDFTGGVSENYDFRTNLPPNLFQIMLQAQQRRSMMGCSIEVQLCRTIYDQTDVMCRTCIWSSNYGTLNNKIACA